MQKYPIKNVVHFLVAAGVIYLYFINSAAFSVYVKEALQLCYNTVIPSLFIFMVFASYLASMNLCRFISLPFVPVFRLLNICDRKIISYCVLGILSGFAAGGYFLNRIREEFDCDKNMLGIISIILSNNSPAFVISAVGTIMLGSFYSGIMLYCSILLSSIITAFIFSFLFPYSQPVPVKNTDNTNMRFSYAINSSVCALLNICGAVVFSYSVCKVISLYSKNMAVSVAFSVLSEVTSACSIITDCYGKNLYLVCIALSFCPLSTCLQLKSHINSSDFSLKILLLSKIVHIPLSLLIMRIAVNLFPQSFAVYASGDINVNMYWNAPHISCWLFILSICFVICFDKKIGVFTKAVK